jgi:hypothetical protein
MLAAVESGPGSAVRREVALVNNDARATGMQLAGRSETKAQGVLGSECSDGALYGEKWRSDARGRMHK